MWTRWLATVMSALGKRRGVPLAQPTHGADLTRVTNGVLGLALVSVWLVHAWRCLQNPLAYMPDDGLFYLQVAFAASHQGGFAFTDVTPTNGYHPLWAWLCTLLGLWSTDRPTLLAFAAATCVALNGVTLLVLHGWLRRQIGSTYPAAALLLGAPFLLFVGFGMEASLAACLMALLLASASAGLRRPSARAVFSCAVLAGLVVAARLDLSVLVLPLCIAVAARYLHGSRCSLAAFVVIGAAACVGVLPAGSFLLDNYRRFADPRPISGILKLAASARVDRAPPFDGSVLSFAGLAVLAALVSGRVARGRGEPMIRWLMSTLALGELGFMAYVWRYGRAELGAWYFCCFPVIGALAAALLLDMSQLAIGARSALRRGLRVLPPLACLAAASLMLMRYGRGRPNEQELAFGSDDGLGSAARQQGIQRVFTFDRPGELAYLDGLSVVAADGLTTNLPFQKELERGGLHWLLEHHAIDALVLPKPGGRYGSNLCDAFYLHALRFRCAPGTRTIDRVELVSRLSGLALGTLGVAGLPRLVFNPPRDLDVVLLRPARPVHTVN